MAEIDRTGPGTANADGVNDLNPEVEDLRVNRVNFNQTLDQLQHADTVLDGRPTTNNSNGDRIDMADRAANNRI